MNDNKIKKKCLDLRSKGYLIIEIANKLNISKSEVRNYIVPGSSYTTVDEIDEMRKLRSDGLSYSHIGRLFNKNRITVYRVLNNKNNKYDTSKDYNNTLTDLEIRKLNTLYNNKKSIQYIANALNITRDQCKHRINIIKSFR